MPEPKTKEKVFCKDCKHTNEYSSVCFAFFIMDYSRENPEQYEKRENLNEAGDFTPLWNPGV